ncbi:MAG: hypothetical protein ABSA76_08570 [Bacteroidales bacterium]
MKESKYIELKEAKWDKWANSLDGKEWEYEIIRQGQNCNNHERTNN